MTEERRLRDLAASGDIPSGSPGRRTPHFEADPLVNVALSHGGAPSEAAEIVRTFSGLRCNTSALNNIGNPASIPNIQKGTLLKDWMIETVEHLTSPENAAAALLPGARLEIVMTFEPPHASVLKHIAGTKETHVDTFFADPELTVLRNTVVQRVSILSVEILIAAAELLNDTRSKQRKEANSLPGLSASSDTPTRASSFYQSQPYDDTRTETDTTHKVSCLHSADINSCVCEPSSGIETAIHRTRSHDPRFAPHQHALLQD